MSAVVLTGDCRKVLGRFPENYFDAVVCDPPYELGFMGKDWDKAGVSFDPETWKAVLRVLKPGGHLLAFGGTRTYHRIVVAIEDAGFEIRDQIQWLYGSGFPKSLNVSKAIDKAAGALAHESVGFTVAGRTDKNLPNPVVKGYTPPAPATPDAERWQGWGTALKPAHEPVVVARKPFKGTVAANVLEHGTGALNIDGCRVEAGDDYHDLDVTQGMSGDPSSYTGPRSEPSKFTPAAGRWPANIILGHHDDCVKVGTKQVKGSRGISAGNPDGNGIYGKAFPRGDRREVGYVDDDGLETVAAWNCHPDCPVRMLDEQTGDRPGGNYPTQRGQAQVTSFASGQITEGGPRKMGDSGGASRFFYHAKASTKEREAGLDDFQPASLGAKGNGLARTCNTCGASVIGGCECPDRTYSNPKRKNNHPTVKPIALMRYLVRLVTPPGGRVLDPFTGSGTTGIAAVLEGFNFVGVELDPEYVTLAQARIKHWTPDA